MIIPKANKIKNDSEIMVANIGLTFNFCCKKVEMGSAIKLNKTAQTI